MGAAGPPPAPRIRYSPRMVTVAIGDVHGCGYELQGLLAAVDRAHAGARLVFVGDLLTKGDHPHEVIRAIIDRRDAGQEIILVCGNHDLRLLAALVRVQSGVSPDQLPKHERQCWHILARHGMLRLAMRLMVEATETTELRDPAAGWTIVHAGIDPQLGLAETPDDVKIHIKALEGERHWWERYTGADGLIVVGHKPLSEPLVLCDAEGRPYVVNIDGQEFGLQYEPGESTTGLFGGNSNWRGPVWMPMNYLIIQSLKTFHQYYGDESRIEVPTGSGNWVSLGEAAKEIARRLTSIFRRDEQGKRPVHGDDDLFHADPHYRDLILFYEYFHGDNSRGVGASHQTGWTGLIADLIDTDCW